MSKSRALACSTEKEQTVPIQERQLSCVRTNRHEALAFNRSVRRRQLQLHKSAAAVGLLLQLQRDDSQTRVLVLCAPFSSEKSHSECVTLLLARGSVPGIAVQLRFIFGLQSLHPFHAAVANDCCDS